MVGYGESIGAFLCPSKTVSVASVVKNGCMRFTTDYTDTVQAPAQMDTDLESCYQRLSVSDAGGICAISGSKNNEE